MNDFKKILEKIEVEITRLQVQPEQNKEGISSLKMIQIDIELRLKFPSCAMKIGQQYENT